MFIHNLIFGFTSYPIASTSHRWERMNYVC